MDEVYRSVVNTPRSECNDLGLVCGKHNYTWRQSDLMVKITTKILNNRDRMQHTLLLTNVTVKPI